MLKLVFRNLWQKKLRTTLTLTGLALATGTLFTLLAFKRGYERGLQGELSQLGAHVLVVPKGCPYDAASLALHGANWPCYLKEAYLTQVAQTPGVEVAAPVLMAAHHGEQREIVVGVTREYVEMRPRWRMNGRFPERAGEVLLGAEAARRYEASVGENVRIELLDTETTVTGILEPVAGPDDDFTFMPLGAAQEALKQVGHLTHVLVKLESPNRLDETVAALRACDAGMQMNVVPLAHLFETIRRVSAGAQYLLGAIAAIAFLVGGTAQANTMFMAVLERTREIGVLKAIGASKQQIFSLFISESLTCGVAGAAIGLTGSWALARFLEAWVRGKIAYAPEASLLGWDGFAVMMSVVFSLVVTCVAGMIPAVRAARMNPVAAFRTQSAY